MQEVCPVIVLEKIADLLDELGEPFDYILNTGDSVVVVRALCSGNHFLYEAKDIYSLLSILEKRRSEDIGCIWCRNS